MKTFTIDHQNRIAAYRSEVPLSEARPEAEVIGSEAEWQALASGWPLARLVSAWNNLPGTTAVKKFTDRETAVRRLWKAMQELEPTATPPAAVDRQGGRPSSRENTKKAHVLALLARPEGATIGEIMAATEWQSHTVRGFLSGTIHKRMGLVLGAHKREDGTRVYRLSEATSSGEGQ